MFVVEYLTIRHIPLDIRRNHVGNSCHQPHLVINLLLFLIIH